MLGISFAIASALFHSVGAIFARLGLQEIKASTGTLISLLSSLVLIGSLALIINIDAFVSLSLLALFWFGLIGLINYTIGRQFRYLGMRHMGVSRAVPLASSSPLFAMVLAIAFTGESANPAIVSGTLCIVVGVSTLASDGSQSIPVTYQRMSTRRDIIIGTAFALGGALAAGVSDVLIRQCVITLAPPLVGATLALLSGTTTLAIIGSRSPESNLGQKKRPVAFLLAAGVGAGLGVASNYFALSLAPVVVISPVTATIPLFVLLLSHFFLRRLEKITLRVLLGAILVVVGVILITFGRVI